MMMEKQREECILNFKIHNEKVENTIRRVEALEVRYNEMIKLSTLLELQMENNKEQDKFLRQQSETLIKINENLTNLSNVTKQLGKRMDNVERDLQGQRMQDLKDKSIDIVGIIKNFIIYSIPVIITAFILFKLGLK